MNVSVVQAFGFMTFLTAVLLVLGEAEALIPAAVPVFGVAWFIVLRGTRDGPRGERR